jgi:hypothetical protein
VITNLRSDLLDFINLAKFTANSIYLRNILEKMSTFLGHQNWGDLLEPVRGDRNSYDQDILFVRYFFELVMQNIIKKGVVSGDNEFEVRLTGQLL